MRALLVSLFAVLSIGCSSSSGSSSADDAGDLDSAIDPGGDSATLGDGAPGTDTSTSGTDAAGGDTSTTPDAAPPIPFCVATCSAPNDCAIASAAYDADNYSCDAGTCKYVGCKSDDECKSSFASALYACRSISGSTTPTCVHVCTAPADCVVASGGTAYDADNWSCESKSCKYLGCNTDDECKSSFGGGSYVCRTVSVPGIDPLPTALKNCVKSCSTPTDCSTTSAAFDADNYACESGACRYKGCNSDAECKSSFAKSNYACR